ncbi:hypothetical protein J4401_06050 [Candidatus Woesearchaeota archaeon]|nr:hypothetical protein [Candidatus Woesearchaeota archaeon]
MRCLILLLILSGCTVDSINKETTLRADILYGHTALMDNYATQEQLLEIGMDMSKINDSNPVSTAEKIRQMEESFGITPSGTYANRIIVLEEKMTRIMLLWEKNFPINNN